MDAYGIGFGIALAVTISICFLSCFFCCVYLCCCSCCPRCFFGFRRKKVGGKKTALITGGNGGIGLALAKLFVEDEWNVIVVARNQEKLEKAKHELEGIRSHELPNCYSSKDVNITTISSDLSKLENVRKLVEDLNKNGTHIDVLVNNAGFGTLGEFETMNENKFLTMINLNVTSLTLLTRLLLPKMIKKGEGAILNVSSIGGHNPVPKYAVYGGTKCYVRSFSFALNHELKKYPNVWVTVLSPGPTESEFDKVAHGGVKTSTSNLPKQSSNGCAYEAYRALMCKRVEVVTDWKTYLYSLFVPFIPMNMLLNQISKGFEPS